MRQIAPSIAVRLMAGMRPTQALPAVFESPQVRSTVKTTTIVAGIVTDEGATMLLAGMAKASRTTTQTTKVSRRTATQLATATPTKMMPVALATTAPRIASLVNVFDALSARATPTHCTHRFHTRLIVTDMLMHTRTHKAAACTCASERMRTTQHTKLCIRSDLLPSSATRLRLLTRPGLATQQRAAQSTGRKCIVGGRMRNQAVRSSTPLTQTGAAGL